MNKFVKIKGGENKYKVLSEKEMNLDDIIIDEMFLKTTPSNQKMKARFDELKKYGKLISYNIVVNENNMLIDGYASYCSLKKFGINKTNVIVGEIVYPQTNEVAPKFSLYIYAIHTFNLPNEETTEENKGFKFGNKEYVWKMRDEDFLNNKSVSIGDIVWAKCKNSQAKVKVTKILVTDTKPITKGNIKCFYV